MKKCKECGAGFEPRNPKGTFCSRSCRQRDYRKRRSAFLETAKKAMMQLPVDYVEIKKVGVLKKDGTVEGIKASPPASSSELSSLHNDVNRMISEEKQRLKNKNK